MNRNNEPANRIRELRNFIVRTSDYQIDNYVHWLEQGAFFFDADYQREYVWAEGEQQAFLTTVVSGFPLGHVAIAKEPDWLSKTGPWLEVVDGKQRLTTLRLFISGDIPLRLHSGDLYWEEMTRAEKRAFGSVSLPAVILDDAGKSDILDYFISCNFTGVPQSMKHKTHVISLRDEMKNGKGG